MEKHNDVIAKKTPLCGSSKINLAAAQGNAQTLRHLLKEVLAAYVLLRAKEPSNILLEDLLDIEIEAGRLVSESLSQKGKGGGFIRMRGSLTETLSYMQMNEAEAPRKNRKKAKAK